MKINSKIKPPCLIKAGSQRTISNFGSDIKDSEIYTDLISQIAPKNSGVNKTAMQRQVTTFLNYFFIQK